MLWHIFENLAQASQQDNADTQLLRLWRQQAIQTLLYVIILFAAPVLILDIISAFVNPNYGPLPTLLYIGFYLVTLWMTFTKLMPHLWRSITVIGITFVIGSLELFQTGFGPSGLLWIQATVVLSVLLFGTTGLFVSGGLASAALLAILVVRLPLYDPLGTAINISIFVLLTVMVSTLIINLTHTLLTSLQHAEQLADDAQQALHHAYHDPLTRLHNRRYLEDHLPPMVAQAQVSSTPVSFLILDVDHFKRFNDTHGHAVGDALLTEMGHILRINIRQHDDLAFRLGGEEFLVVMPGASLEIAAKQADLLRLAISDLSVSQAGQALPPVTTSIGVSSFPQHGHTAEQCLVAADAALYHAKRNGRNQVQVADAVPDLIPVQ